ncbi:RICIN domain-containing protein [Streptomyces sp. NPDC088921]|uniref:RICIN domain-containing protein n=1 Tax=unclassified Streptomyces TaxID=2593676 RepID=UPI0034453419
MAATRRAPREQADRRGATPVAANSQKWTLTDAGNGYYELKNVGSGFNAAVAQSPTSNGAAVVQWNDLNIDDQFWKIVRVN